MKNNETQKVSFRITDNTRNSVLAIIQTKPFNTVFGITKTLEKDVITEDEANAIINVLGQFPYAEVASFFSQVKDLFEMINETDVNESAEKAEKTETVDTVEK